MHHTTNVDELVRDVSVRMGVGIPKVRGPMDGWSHQVFRLEYPSGEVWSLRIPKSKDDALYCETGLAILDHLKKVQPTLRIPTPLYRSQDYHLLTFLDGDALNAWDSCKLTEKRRHKLLQSLAKFLLKLWSSPAPKSGKKLTQANVCGNRLLLT